MNKSVTCQEVEDAIYSTSKYITDVKLFDVYVGAPIPHNMKSMAFTVTFTPQNEEFKNGEVDGYVDKILRKLKFTMGIELRS